MYVAYVRITFKNYLQPTISTLAYKQGQGEMNRF